MVPIASGKSKTITWGDYFDFPEHDIFGHGPHTNLHIYFGGHGRSGNNTNMSCHVGGVPKHPHPQGSLKCEHKGGSDYNNTRLTITNNTPISRKKLQDKKAFVITGHDKN